MSEHTKHTPGPWKNDFGIIKSGSTPIAKIISPGNMTVQEPMFNAVLIAAAPELLDALKEAVELCCDACDWSVMTPEERGGCVTNKWRKIIAKAEGYDHEPCRKVF